MTLITLSTASSSGDESDDAAESSLDLDLGDLRLDDLPVNSAFSALILSFLISPFRFFFVVVFGFSGSANLTDNPVPVRLYGGGCVVPSAATIGCAPPPPSTSAGVVVPLELGCEPQPDAQDVSIQRCNLTFDTERGEVVQQP